MSLRARILAGAGLIALVLAVAAVVITRVTEAHLLDQVDAQLAGSGGPMRGFDNGGPPHRGPFGGPPGQPSEFYVAVVTGGGMVEPVFEPNLGDGEAPLPSLDADDAMAAAATGTPYTVSAEGSDRRYRLLAFTSGPSGSTFVVGLPLDDVDNAVGRLVMVELAATTAVLAVVGLVSWWVLRLGVRPVKEMTAAASAIATGDLSDRVPETASGTEAGALSIALNQMLGRIEAAFDARARSEERLRRFVADASHELRTPVTTIRGYAELFRAGGLENPDELAAALRRAEQEAVRMGSLIDDLLSLARLDQGRSLERRPVDLAVIVADAVRDASAVDRGRHLSTATDGALVVAGDDAGLRQVVANVVGNAIVHTPAGTPVSVRLHRTPDRAVIEVADEGPGMTAEVAGRAFERFYRADPSRSRHRGGSGLGLAIVDATVTAHGGTVSLQSEPGAGTTVRIELPLDDRPG